MGEWDAFQLRDGTGGHSPVLNPPDFAVVLSSPESRIPQTPQQQVPTDTPPQGAAPTDKTNQPQLSDAQIQSAVHDGTLELKYGDPNMDQYLQRAQYQTIDIQIPQGVQVTHWVDQQGNFFWFQGGNDNGTRHYYPPTAKTMTVNGHSLDLESQRLKVDEAYAASAGGFQSFTGKTDAMTYFSRMSGLSSQSLQTLENSLAGSVQTSSNPYFKIYLADVYTAEAMQPIVQQVLQSGTASLNNPQTLQKLNQAIQLTQAAQSDSSQGLGKVNRNPPGNTVLPMDPYEIYSNPNDSQYYYGFWGGSLDQARQREVALTTLRNLIQNNALPKIELPPALPPG